MSGGKWLDGKGRTQFQQFSAARITRNPFPLCGYFYHTTDSGTQKQLYSGNNYEAARAAIAKATGAE